MLTRHIRKELLGHGGITRIARTTFRPNGKPYSLSRVSQVVNCERTGQRSPVIEQAVVAELQRLHSNIDPSTVFPPAATEQR